MNREIKFRAWDKVNNIMRIITEISFRTNTIDVEPQEGTLETFDLYDVLLAKDEYVLMEYTGLKDKKDIKIYEGDIIEDSDKKRHVVIFRNGGFGREGRFLINYRTEEYAITHEPLINDVVEGCEVIGNIYENAELLQVEK